jgi:UDP-N-acetylglucosamine 2-epimerase (non-hydrolysing)
MKALSERGVEQVLVHTGQHYDDALSTVFFEELALPRPDVNLGVGSGSHAQQTAAIMTGIEAILVEHSPAVVVVYGDVNSTVGAALVASKMGVPVAHIEAGLRSFDRSMPEEINRLVTDSLSDHLFATSRDALDHLSREGIETAKVHFVGNPMIDTLLAHHDRLDATRERDGLGLDGEYAVATIHRPGNVDDPSAARLVVGALHHVADAMPLVIPVHPRGRRALEAAGLLAHSGVHVLDPMPYTRFLGLVRTSRLVVTDSGGLQEETTMLRVPCLTLRPNTERPVTITHGTNRLVTPESLKDAVRDVLVGGSVSDQVPELWDGNAGPRIADVLVREVDTSPRLVRSV